jgi:hypothetical protein
MTPLELRSRWGRVSMQPWMLPLTERRIYWRWALAGRPVPPPPIVKQRIVRQHQRPGVRTFIETGTHTGAPGRARAKVGRRPCSPRSRRS